MFFNVIFIKNELIHFGFTIVWVDLETNIEVEFSLNLLLLIRIDIDSHHTFAYSLEFV